MSLRAVAIGLKIPDNEAYTALVALRRLGVDAAGIERSAIWQYDDDGDPAELVTRIERDESTFNPNKHRLTLLEADIPRPGELWITPLRREAPESKDERSAQRIAVAWRLFDGDGKPLRAELLAAAAERLLCNPAIERAAYSTTP